MLDLRQRVEIYKDINPNGLTPQQLLDLETEIKSPESGNFSDELLDFKLWSYELPCRQEIFGNFLAKKLKKYQDANILEVGCGRTGKLSRILSKKGFKMTGIDPKLEITSCENVEFIKDSFDYTFDLSQYDFVIAQEPCDATEHIVRACINQQKPFMMSLCGVPHKLLSGEEPKDAYDWYNYLVNISSEQIKLRYLDLDPFSLTPLLRSNKF